MSVFRPTGDNVNIATSTSSASAAVPENNPAGSAKPRVMRLVNGSALAAPQAMFVKTGPGAQTATNANAPVNPGAELIIPYPEGHTQVGVIAAGVSVLYAQPGVMENF